MLCLLVITTGFHGLRNWTDWTENFGTSIFLCFSFVIQQHSSCQRLNLGGASSLIIIVVRNGQCDGSSILDEADCISHWTNTIEKGINSIILPPGIGK